MKKLLATLLSVLIIFSCVSLLGTNTALAEQKKGDVLFTSDFIANASGTRWTASHSFVQFLDEDGDGTKDFARLTASQTIKTQQLISYGVELIPGNSYELSFLMRIPEGNADYTFDNQFAPNIVIYQPETADNGKATTYWKEGQNEYAYGYESDNTKTRRTNFTSNLQIGDNEAVVREKFSIYDFTSFYNAIGNRDAILNDAFTDWTKVKISFTAIASEENDGPQTVAVSFGFKVKGTFSFDVKEISMECTEVLDDSNEPGDEPGEPEPPQDPVEPEIPENTTTDNGYIVNNGDTSTATPYDGNEFLGWYKTDSTTPYSTDATIATATITAENLTAKFLSHNNVTENGYEELETGTNLINDTWAHAGTQDSWVNLTVSETYAKSGKKSLKLSSRQQKDIYLKLNGLKANTNYVVSYSWLLPVSAEDDTNTASDGYYGSAIGTTATTKIQNCFAKGDYTGTINQSYVGGQWNKVKYVFNTKENTDLRLFLWYDSAAKSGNDSMYLDEVMIYELEYENDHAGFDKYTINVIGENSYAFNVTDSDVADAGSEVTVVATPYGGYEFDGWYEKDVKVSEDKMYTFVANAHRTLVAKSVLATTNGPITPDIDNNNTVNLDDVVALAQHVAGWEVANINTSVIDTDGNGTTDLSDLVLLAQYVAGWEVEDKLAPSSTTVSVLPLEDLNDPNLKATLLSGQSKYFNESTIINNGNTALIANLFKKAQSGQDITIVSLGGSVTQALGEKGDYGLFTAQWLREQFPDITVNFVNSGIGSTPSIVGIHRLQSDVLDHNPDLVFVDFCVNDISLKKDAKWRYRETYETIIRKLVSNKVAVMALVFGTTDASNPKFSPTALNGHLPSMLYYDIPVIDYYGALWRYVDNGVVDWYKYTTDASGGKTATSDSLTVDGLHPSATGHVMISSAIKYYLSKVLKNINNVDLTIPEVPEESFFGGDVFETATFLASSTHLGYTQIVPTSIEGFAPATVHNKIGTGWICDSNGGSLTVELKGVRSIAIFLRLAPNNGRGTITINGEVITSNYSTNNTAKHIWIHYLKEYDTPQDLTITFEADGQFGIGPIGVCY